MYKYDRNRFSMDTTNNPSGVIKPTPLSMLADNKSFYGGNISSTGLGKSSYDTIGKFNLKSPQKDKLKETFHFPSANTLSKFFQNENEKIQSNSRRGATTFSPVMGKGSKEKSSNQNLPTIKVNTMNR
jgi:hypothetical protein